MTEQPASPPPRPYDEVDRIGADVQTPPVGIESAPSDPSGPPETEDDQAPDEAEAAPGEPDRGEIAGPDEAAGSNTGVPEVDGLLGVLEDLDVLPIEDHAQVFAEAHQRLHQTLLSADEE